MHKTIEALLSEMNTLAEEGQPPAAPVAPPSEPVISVLPQGQEQQQVYPSLQQLMGQFVKDLELWESAFATFPEDVQDEIEGVLYQADGAEEMLPSSMRQLAVIFNGNAKDNSAVRIGKAIQFLADSMEFVPAAQDIMIDSHVGETDDEDEGEGDEDK
jgi:hypothetical protein